MNLEAKKRVIESLIEELENEDGESLKPKKEEKSEEPAEMEASPSDSDELSSSEMKMLVDEYMRG